MLKDRRGQNTVEYLLMLAVVVGVVLIAGVSLKRFMPDLFAKVTAPIDKFFGKGGDSSSPAGSESSSSALGGSKPWSSLLPGGGDAGSASGSSAGGGQTGGGPGGGGLAGSGRSPAAGGSSGGSAYVGGGSMVPGAVSGGAAGGGSSGGGSVGGPVGSAGGGSPGAGASGADGSGGGGPGGGGFAGSGSGPGGSAQGPSGSAPTAGGRSGAGAGAGSGAGGRQDGGPGGSAAAVPAAGAGTGGGSASSGASQTGQGGAGGGSGAPSLAGVVAQAQALASLARGADPAALAQWRRLCAGLAPADLRPPSEERRSKEFESLLRASKELADAYQNWGNLTPAQKVRALQALASIFGQAYGLPQLRVVAFDFSGEQGGILAFHRADGALLVNPASLGDRDAAMDAVLHQSWHRYQEDMVTRLNSGQIPPTDDRYELVRLLAASQGVSGPPGDYESFRANPMEAQAHLFDGVGSMTLATLAGGRAEVRDLWGDLGRAVRGDGSVPHRKRMLILSLLGGSLLIALAMGYVVIRAESGG
ncbi:MAG: hypothetical protein HY927_02070 [Elusimicrobia bacterium]|nr:hypothetical protein [Elusimicrobiota bacterium]